MIPAFWTSTEIEFVRKLATEGCTVAEIKEHFPNRTRNAIIGMMNRNGIQNFSRLAAKAQERKVRAQSKPAAAPARTNAKRGRAYTPPYLTEKPVRASGKHKTIMELGFFDCRAVVGPIDGQYTRFCCNPVKKESSWCEEHFAIYHAKPTPGAKNEEGNKKRIKYDFRKRGAY